MKWFFVPALLLLIWCSSCNSGADSSDIGGPQDTTLFTGPQPNGITVDPSLAETSGVAPSRQNPGYLWTEEDSGNANQIQLINPEGELAARFTLPTLENHDWEDIATGFGPVAGQSYIYLAEIGDNVASFTNQLLYGFTGRSANKIIYRFPEPSLAGRKLPVTGAITRIDAITLTLADGPKDAEAILVDPLSNDLFVLSKGTTSSVYRAAYPQSLTQPIVMQPLLTLPFKRVTSAAISPDGTEILIRTYRQLFYYKRQPGESVVSALSKPPRLMPVAFEPQGEAVGWQLDGCGYFTLSESWSDNPKPIYFYERKPAAASTVLR